tara:strand:+ start:38 stop:187 length:150 start_codon:yes stop_codon:yes gene_type:complete
MSSVLTALSSIPTGKMKHVKKFGKSIHGVIFGFYCCVSIRLQDENNRSR